MIVRMPSEEHDVEPRLRAPNQVESELRALLLRSARAYPDVIGAYLTRVEKIVRWPDEAHRELMAYQRPWNRDSFGRSSKGRNSNDIGAVEQPAALADRHATLCSGATVARGWAHWL